MVEAHPPISRRQRHDQLGSLEPELLHLWSVRIIHFHVLHEAIQAGLVGEVQLRHVCCSDWCNGIFCHQHLLCSTVTSYWV